MWKSYGRICNLIIATLVLLALGAPGLAVSAAPPQPVIDPTNAAGLVETARITLGPWDLVTALAWSPNGSTLVAGAGNRLLFFDRQSLDERASGLASGQASELASLKIRALTNGLAFSPDGRWLAAGSRDGMVRVWDAGALLAPGGFSSSSQPVYILDAHKKGVNTIAFSPDSRWLASGGNDAVARVWDLQTGQLVTMIVGGTYAVPSVAFTPDGSALAVANGDVVRLREVNDGRIMGTFYAETPLFSLAFHPDGTLIAASDHENKVRLWNPDQAFRAGMENYPTPVTLAGHQGQPGNFTSLVWRVIFSADGSLLVSAGGDGALRVWDTAYAILLNSLIGHTAAVTCVVFQPDGAGLTSGGLDGTIRLWQFR